MRRAFAHRLVAAAVAAELVVAACGGGAPSGGPGTSAAASPSAASGVVTSAAPSDTVPEGVALVSFAGTDDPAAASEREIALVGEMREDAGMVALLGATGADGAALFAALDALQAEFAQGVLTDAATIVDTGTFPQGFADPLAGRLAALDGGPPAVHVAPGAIDISLFADTGFTTSALMSMLSQVIQRAGESQSGTVSSSEPHRREADGLRQDVQLTTTISLTTGAGKVSVDLTLTATDNISRVADGTYVALYTSTSTGHFDVDACPDDGGVALGTYSFETKHELNDVSATTAARSGAGRSATAPFRLIDGPDAHLQRIETSLDLQADARGPGSPSGPGPTSAFDWAASQLVQVVMPARGGSTTATGGRAAVTGTGGERAAGAMFLSSAMALLFLGEVGKEAERYWRSGECIDLVPSDDTRSVDPNEEIDLTVEAKEAFGGGSIEEPIVATFSGTKSLDPVGQPVDAPATFHFVAGAERGDKGTIDLKQTSVRGLGLRQVVYTVESQSLEVEVDASATSSAAGSRYESTVHIAPITLAPGDDGLLSGTGPATWETLWHPGIAGCPPKTYEGSFVVRITARIDDADPDRAFVRVAYVSGDAGKAEIVMCNGYPTPYLGGTAVPALGRLAADEVPVELGGSATLELPIAGGRTTQTVHVRSGASP